MKKLSIILLLSVFAFSLSASVMGGSLSDVRVAKTEHFDIIYDDICMETASLIYENCEEIYDSLVSSFGTDPKIHIPVVITSRYKDFNANYTNYPSNRIVMYDTVSDIGMLTSQTFLNVFRHELTHAFEYNIRGPFFNALSKVFGDSVSMESAFYMYRSLAEGGAVYFESEDGDGRLNSSYAMQIVRQAKLEGCFPNWVEISGSRDTYPSGALPYLFSAAFLEYLSITYGKDIVSAIYRDFANFKLWPNPGLVIRDHIGKDVDKAWQDFYEWVEVPTSVIEAPTLEALPRNGRYSALRLSSDGCIYFYDLSTYSVMKISPDMTSCSSVLTLPTENPSLSISSDAKRLIIPFVSSEDSGVRVYDISADSAKVLHTFRSDYRIPHDGAFVTLDGEECVLLMENSGLNVYLDLYTSDSFTEVPGKSMWLGHDVHVSDFVRFGENKVAFIMSYDAKYNIAILNLSDMSVKLLDNPQNLEIMRLSLGKTGNDEILCFSWYPDDAKATNMGRYGEISLSGGAYYMRLSDADVLGGTCDPVRVDDKVYFSAHMFEKDRMQVLDSESLLISDSELVLTTSMTEIQRPSASNLANASAKYRPLNYFMDGTLLPYTTSAFALSGSQLVGLGLTYITADPTLSFVNSVAAGYGFGNVLGSYRFTFNGDTSVSVSFDIAYGTGKGDSPITLPKGLLLLGPAASVSHTFKLRDPNEVIKVGDDYNNITLILPSTGDYAVRHINKLYAQYDRKIKTGLGPYQYRQYTAQVYSSMFLPGIALGVTLPSLLWWRCDGPHVTNLPLRLVADAHFEGNYENISLTGQATVILYGLEIQRAIQFLGLHVQRFTLDASYAANYQTQTGSFVHVAQLSARFSFTPVIFAFTSSMKMQLGASLLWDSVSDSLRVQIAFDT
ncbi:MAG: hypothetical protein J6P81_02565 [Spirochaetales bacterium]|nr:hypothetical protein [Spirochaetales bacterium]